MVNKKCHIFTPRDIVNKMLDEIGYNQNLFGKKFLENSCGDGNILCEAIKKYIDDCLDKNMSKSEIKCGLENDFFGVEFYKKNFIKCIENINKVVETYGIKNVNWNIKNTDFLSLNINYKFDFIVGNPPYISYHELDDITRRYIREKFEYCKNGKFDYYYPFIEKSLKLLNKNGKLAYLIPTNLFKNVFASDLREFIKSDLCKIIDYTTQKIFKNILTSSSIIICDMTRNSDYFEYYDVSKNEVCYLDKKKLGNKWIFNHNYDKNSVKFSEYFLAATSVATLLNEAFVIKEYTELEKHFLVSEILVEKDVVRKAASPRALSKNKEEIIIFPYYFRDSKLSRYTIKDFTDLYPGASKHLSKFKDKLEKRASDVYTNWFEYGRRQALENLNQKKLLMSFIVTNKVNIYEIDEDTIPYSGIYIVPKSNVGLEKAKEILTSSKFLEYVKSVGIHISGSSLRITANDIKNFDISEWR